MTLQEWIDKHEARPADSRFGTAVIAETGHPGRNELYHLTDYVVSSSAGPVVWLRPRPDTTEKGS